MRSSRCATASIPSAASRTPTSTACSGSASTPPNFGARRCDGTASHPTFARGWSDQGPGVAAAGAVDREAGVTDDGARASEEGVALEGVEQLGEVVGHAGVEEALHLLEQREGDRF